MKAQYWHTPGNYIKFLETLRQLDHEWQCWFLVPQSAASELSNALEAGEVAPERYRILHPTFAELPRYLCAADFGILFLEHEKKVVATKVVEYLACGLPTLLNANVRGAADLLKLCDGGLVIHIGLGDRDNFTESICYKDLMPFLSLEKRKEIADFAKRNLSNRVVASKYIEVYRSITN